jgi:hypothetical protein
LRYIIRMTPTKHRDLHSYCLLFISLALVLMPFVTIPAPAQAGRLIWSTVDTPGTAFSVIASPSEISDIVISADGRTLFTVDTANSRVYRSDDAGAGWTDLTNYLVAAGAALPAWEIAVAPDNPRFLAAVTSSGGMPHNVFVSADGGQSWSNTSFPAGGNISSLSISPSYGNYDIAVGTRSGGAGAVYIYKATGMGGSWAAQGFSGDVLSVKFSPSYRTDTSIAVLYSTAAGTFFNVGIHDLNANVTNWTAIYISNIPEITASGAGTSPKASQVIGGNLELPVDFSGQSPSLSRAYISVDATGGSAGIFRVDNSIVFQLMNAQSNHRISSISYTGTYLNGKLLAGEVTGDPARAAVLTWYTDAPMTCPATCWYQSEKPPTGAGTSGYGNAQVIWAPDGSRAYCGTSSALLSSPATWPSAYATGTALDESALSISRDNGRNWNQVSLIDTQISFLSDVVVTIDSNTMYLATINNTGAGLDSIWHSTAQTSSRSWERVLCFPAASNDIILRTNNYSNDQAIFAASRNTDDLRQSQDGGQTWKTQLPGMALTDFSVTSLNNTRYVYVLGSNGYVRKGNASSLTPQWSQQVATTLVSGHTIFAAPNGVIVAGGDATDNRVAFSADGGSSFIVTTPLPIQGAIHTIVDYRINNAFIIYAATDNPGSDIYALVSMSGPWNFMGAPNTGFWSLAQMGTLFGLSSTAGGPAVDRTLSPEQLGPPAIEWDMLNAGLTGGVVFTREPVALKLSSGINLWAIDNRPYNLSLNTGRLWTFCDCLSPGPQYSAPSTSSTPSAPAAPAVPPREVLFAAPVPYAPQPDDLIPIFINDNSVGEITFKWKPKTTAVAYELWLSANADFSNVLLKKTITVENRRAPSWTMVDKKGIEPGHTYYWKVRIVQAATGEKGTGEWSEIFPFTIAENTVKKPVAQPVVTGPADNRSTNPAGENKTRPASNVPEVFKELWFWQAGAALFIILVVALVIVLLTNRSHRL